MKRAEDVRPPWRLVWNRGGMPVGGFVSRRVCRFRVVGGPRGRGSCARVAAAGYGALTLVVVNQNTGRSRRFVIQPSADEKPDLPARVRDRTQAFLARGRVP